ncbi:MAG: GNAT family N-acetyltransferase [Saprospiraceae bacterium]
MNTTIRPVQAADIEQLTVVIDSSELFPSEMLDDMIADFLQNANSEQIWRTAEVDNQLVGIAYAAPEMMTEGTYNLYLIAVHKSVQGKGIGGQLMRHFEDLLREQNVRILLVETSGLAEFELTREFYDKLDYQRAAVIPEFYAAGEDKVVFWKKLNR